jgi:short-subunit dehydrogenase
LDEVAAEARSAGGLVEPLVADLATSAGVEAVLAHVAERKVHLLVNNAGFATYGHFDELDGERERQLLRLNIEAVVALTRGVLPALISNRGGVINVASQMAFQPVPYFATYAASKAFVLSFSEAIAEEFRGRINVTAVAPGFVRTEFGRVAGGHSPAERLPQLAPRQVVEAAMEAFDHGRTVRTVGAPYRLMVAASRVTPRSVMRRAMAAAMRPVDTADQPHS